VTVRIPKGVLIALGLLLVVGLTVAVTLAVSGKDDGEGGESAAEPAVEMSTVDSLISCLEVKPEPPEKVVGTTIQTVRMAPGVEVLLVSVRPDLSADRIAASYERRPGWEVFRTTDESLLAVLASSRSGTAVEATRVVLEDCIS